MSTRVSEVAQRILNTRVQYAWGGGHGAIPGPSQGLRDGGLADFNGDYLKVGLDASGLVRWFVYLWTGDNAADGNTMTQYADSVPVPFEEARPGDLFFPDSHNRGYVTVYLGGGTQLEIRKSGERVRVSPISTTGEFRRCVSVTDDIEVPV